MRTLTARARGDAPPLHVEFAHRGLSSPHVLPYTFSVIDSRVVSTTYSTELRYDPCTYSCESFMFCV